MTDAVFPLAFSAVLVVKAFAMERKSAHNGSRSADARSPDGSEHARRDGAHKTSSASSFSGKPGNKGAHGGQRQNAQQGGRN